MAKKVNPDNQEIRKRIVERAARSAANRKRLIENGIRGVTEQPKSVWLKGKPKDMGISEWTVRRRQAVAIANRKVRGKALGERASALVTINRLAPKKLDELSKRQLLALKKAARIAGSHTVGSHVERLPGGGAKVVKKSAYPATKTNVVRYGPGTAKRMEKLAIQAGKNASENARQRTKYGLSGVTPWKSKVAHIEGSRKIWGPMAKLSIATLFARHLMGDKKGKRD